MKKIIRLNENDLVRLINTVIREEGEPMQFKFDKVDINDAEVAKVGQELGIKLTPEEVDAFSCNVSDQVPQQFKKEFETITGRMKTATREQLKSEYKKLRNALKLQRQEKKQLKKQGGVYEQAGVVAAATVFGLPLTTVALGAIGFLLLIKIISSIFRRREKSGCRAGDRQRFLEFGKKENLGFYR